MLDTFTSAAPTIDGWELISAADNWMYQRGNLLFKTARPGHEPRVSNGLAAATTIATSDIRQHLVAAPVASTFATIHGTHRGSLWPRHDPRTSPLEALLAYQRLHDHRHELPDFGVLHFDPWPKIRERLNAHNDARWEPLLPWLDRIEAQIDAALELPRQSQHGDASTDNTVRDLHDPTVAVLIDLDSAGQHPVGWDRACLLYTALFNNTARFGTEWPISDYAEMLLPIKWALSMSWHLAQGRTPPTADLAASFAWTT